MEIEKHSDKKLISVWLTNADQQDAVLLSWLKCQYPKWKSEGYLTAVYYSGKENLYENTLALLRHNRRLQVMKALAAEKQSRMNMNVEGGIV